MNHDEHIQEAAEDIGKLIAWRVFHPAFQVGRFKTAEELRAACAAYPDPMFKNIPMREALNAE
jgi:hypothetical protein